MPVYKLFELPSYVYQVWCW